MLIYFILGVALLAGSILIMRWYVNAEPKTLLRVLKWGTLAIILLIGLFLAVTGRLGWAMTTLPALFAWLMRFRMLARTARDFSRMGRAAPGGGAGRRSAIMSREEALQVLGLEEGASADDIKTAHRRLIDGLHPDHGGSTYLAAQINQAKDVLLGG